MPIIAPQHAWKSPDHVPDAGWPDDCMVQWGDRGLVLKAAGGGYNTAFFEAFPKGHGFIRGEGETIAAAEAAALVQFRKEAACVHGWSRRSYTNGGGFCRNCGAFMTVFQPIVILGDWRRPLSSFEISSAIEGGCASTEADAGARSRKFVRRRYLRIRMHGIPLPPPPEEVIPLRQLDDHPYTRQCRDAVMEWLASKGGPEALASGSGPGVLDGFFDAMASRTLRREYEEWLEDRGAAATGLDPATEEDAPCP